jgi:hypothetical protein
MYAGGENCVTSLKDNRKIYFKKLWNVPALWVKTFSFREFLLGKWLVAIESYGRIKDSQQSHTGLSSNQKGPKWGDWLNRWWYIYSKTDDVTEVEKKLGYPDKWTKQFIKQCVSISCICFFLKVPRVGSGRVALEALTDRWGYKASLLLFTTFSHFLWRSWITYTIKWHQ